MNPYLEVVHGFVGFEGSCKLCGWRSAIGHANTKLASADARAHECSGPRDGRPIVGIDPSLTATGVVVLRPSLDACTVKSEALPKGERNVHDHSARIERTAAKISELVPLGAAVAIEEPARMAKHGNPDERAGLRWSLIARLRHRGCLVVQVPPKSAKMWLTDNGNADKAAMTAAAKNLAPDGLRIKTEHEGDAFAFATMLAAHLGAPVIPAPPRAAKALAGVAWAPIEGNEK